MSLTTVVTVNVILDFAVVAALAAAMRIPFRLDRPRATVAPMSRDRDLRRAA